MTVLIADEDEGARRLGAETLAGAGYSTRTASTGAQALAVLDEGDTDAVVADAKLPGLSGLDLVRVIQERGSDAEVVLTSANATIATAVEAMKLGANDYLGKPFQPADLLRCVERAGQRREARADARLLQEHLKGRPDFYGMVGTSSPLQQVFRQILEIANKRQPVLITGETGTGKELAARAIHAASPWRAEPFVVVDCGGLSSSLIETDLFGHVRGAFTGAVQARAGLLAKAGRGTVFFDEVGELPPEMQVKLLRLIQERQFRSVGSDHFRETGARIVAATNVDLESAVERGTFRKDLFYRLNVYRIAIPPLRERRTDIEALVEHVTGRQGQAESEAPQITPEALQALMCYSWPGNVRELENCLQRVAAACGGRVITIEHLPREIARAAAGRSPTVQGYLARLEQEAILEMLKATGWNCAKAARLLGVAKTTVYRKLRDYGLDGWKDGGAESGEPGSDGRMPPGLAVAGGGGGAGAADSRECRRSAFQPGGQGRHGGRAGKAGEQVAAAGW